MRTVNRADLENATDYRWLFNENMPESFPGSTAVGVSRKVLTALKTKGEADLRVPEGGIAGAVGSLLSGILASSDLDSATMMQGTLKRVEAKPVPFKVILNDDPVELMAIHARGQLGDEDAEFWILDDGDNPLALKWEVAGNASTGDPIVVSGSGAHDGEGERAAGSAKPSAAPTPASSAPPTPPPAPPSVSRRISPKRAVRSFTASTSTLRAIESRRNPSRCSPKSRKCCGRIRPGT